MTKSVSVFAQVNTCPNGFNDTPALASHISQADIVAGKYPFNKIFAFGRQLFTTNFNKCAYLAAGRVADAERLLAWLSACAARLPCRFPRIAEAAGRAQLAELKGDHDQADASFRVALALHDEVDLPLEEVETLLGYGAFLRRSGQPARARPQLARAIEVAEAAGAGWLAAMAREELKVAGGRRRRRDQSALTAQEQRVADLAAAGLSNAQIARQLYVSASTVETHLEHVYAKLGIHSRHQLMAKAEAGRPL